MGDVDGVNAENGAVVITMKPRRPLEVEVDIDALTWGDVAAFEKFAQTGAVDTNDARQMEEMLALVQKCIGERDVNTLPVRAIAPLVRAIMDALQTEMAGPPAKN
jgi:hypothetical protein